MAIVRHEDYLILEKFNLPVTNDNLLCASCYRYNLQVSPIVFVSLDNNCNLIASKIFKLSVEPYIYYPSGDEYIGYKYVVMDNDEMAYFYERLNENTQDCLTNQYLIIENSNDGKTDKLKWNGEKYVPLKFKFVNHDLVGKVKPINNEQIRLTSYKTLIAPSKFCRAKWVQVKHI